MKLLSIYVGNIKTVNYQGREITTGIYKNLVEGAVKVKKLSLEGDKQADLSVHGGKDKAVYAYPSEHYEFWKNKRPDLSFEAGKFGENLSITGLNELEVYVGDTYKIGSAVFKVTSPRLPCFKLGIKMDNPNFIKDFLEAKLTGFYFSVEEEGIIEAGDEIIQLSQDEHKLSIDEMTRLYSEDRFNTPLLEKAVNTPSLSQDWVDFFQKRLGAFKK